MINRHELHILLVDFKLPQTYFSFFSKKTTLRNTIESIRGDLQQHAAEKYIHFYEDLTPEEMDQLIKALKIYIKHNVINDMSKVDNFMLHHFICKHFLHYELNEPFIDENDYFRSAINDYFLKLNNELQLIDEKKEQGSSVVLNIWLTHLIHYPAAYIGHFWVGGMGNDYNLPSLGLGECGCIDVSHDRLFSDVRPTVERMVLEACIKSPKNPLKLVSMGPGKGLQEFFIVYKLLQMGIRTIELSLVEPKYSALLDPIPHYVREIYCPDQPDDSPLPEKYYTSCEGETYNIIRAISLLSRYFTDVNIQVFQYSSLGNLTKAKEINTPFDVAFAIDFENYSPDVRNQSFSDIHALATLLKPTGKAIVSSHYQIRSFEVDGDSLRETNLLEFEKITPTEKGYVRKHHIDTCFKI